MGTLEQDAHRSPDDQRKLAKYLARKIFEAPHGCDPDEVKRLQFRGLGERDMGGLCEGALSNFIRQALRDYK